jgi:hypothetical protein
MLHHTRWQTGSKTNEFEYLCIFFGYRSNPNPNPTTPNAHDPPRAPSAMSRSPKPPRSGHSRHTLKEKDDSIHSYGILELERNNLVV